jgi:serine protease Do/serine protease DegQ
MSRITVLKTAAAAACGALAAGGLTLVLSTAPAPPAHADVPLAAIPQAASGQVPSLAPMVKTVLPTVVNITVSAKVQIQNPLMNDPLARRFFNLPDQPQEREEQAIGSGVIVDASKGYILTNNHVVAEAEKIKVRLNDDRTYDAKLIGTDPPSDIAVLQIKPENLASLPLGQSSELQVGDFVVAVGSPFNLRGTVTAGIVSALGRTTDGAADGTYQDFIQTDASINPGNSGGALVNLHGELVGINTQILSNGGGSIGIGFAIPIDLAKSVMTQLIASGKVERGRIGIGGQPLTPELARALGIKEAHGALIDNVVPDSPADKAGLKKGDVVIAANGRQISTMQELRTLVGETPIGGKVELSVVRNSETRQFTVTVGKNDKDKAAGKTLSPKLAGATFGPPQTSSEKGVQVLTVEPGSPAAQEGLRPGDVIQAVNRHEVANMDEFTSLASDQQGDLLLYVLRNDNGFFLLLQ